MISVAKIAKEFGERSLFSDVSFQIGKGERWGLVGRNGSGKSTLMKILCGQESSDQGEVMIPKKYRIGWLQQHLQFTASTIVQEAMSSGCQEYQAETILLGLGFSVADMSVDPSSLSGGYQLRLELAKVLLSEPDCLILDEPTNYLDIVAIRWLEKFLTTWKSEMIVVSHDRSFLDKVVSHVMGIYRGKIRRVKGNTEKFYEQMFVEDQVYNRTKDKMDKKREHMQSFVDRFAAKASKAAQARSRVKAIEKIKDMDVLQQEANLAFQFSEKEHPGKRVMELKGVDFSYTRPGIGSKTPFSFSDLSLLIEKDTRLAIAGKNGRGKSTVLSLLAGVKEPTKGEIYRSDHLSVGYFGQTNIERLHPEHTVEQEIASVNPDLAFGRVRELAGLMMFSGLDAEKRISVLSGGEKSRVLLAKILAKPCNLLLLDEPTHHLDMESVQSLFVALDHFTGAVVLVTHDETLLHHFAKQMVICSEKGVEFFDGDYPLFLEKKGWEEREIESGSEKKKAVSSRKSAQTQIENQIAKCEKRIAVQEAELLQLEAKVAALAVEGDREKMAAVSQQMQKKEQEIDQLNQMLDQLIEQL